MMIFKFLKDPMKPKQALACYLCRKKKIACKRPDFGFDDQTCQYVYCSLHTIILLLCSYVLPKAVPEEKHTLRIL